MTGRELLAGLDVGTTSVKALLLTGEGTEVALGRAPTTWTTTDQGTETTGQAVLDAARRALAEALSQVPGDRVIGIGIASMAESGVLVSADDTPVAPVVAWHDRRDEQQLHELVATFGGRAFSTRTGLPLWTQWSLTKHRWLVDHLPSARSAVRRYNIAEWVARGLGGDPVAELSLTSRTGWLDLATKQLWDEALSWSGAAASLVPPLVQAGTAIGTAHTDGDLAAADGAVLTIAGHDHQAAVVGLGCSGPGDEFDSCGTAEAFVRTVAAGLAPPAISELTAAGVTVGWHVIADRWCLLGATQGGLVLGRVQAALGVDRAGLADLDAAALAAALAARGSGGSDGAVLQVSDAAEVTLPPGADPGEVWLAAVQLVTAQAKELGETLDRASGPRRDLVVAGGWTHSAALMAVKAAAFGPLRRATTTEAGGRGAALLAGLANGTYASYDDLPTDARITDAHTPDAPTPRRPHP